MSHRQVIKQISDVSLPIMRTVVEDHGTAINFLLNLFEPVNSVENVNSDVDNYDIRDQWTIRVVSDQARHIKGIMRGEPGRLLFIVNGGSQDVILDYNSPPPTAPENRILTISGGNRTIASGQIALLMYDNPGLIWRTVV